MNSRERTFRALNFEEPDRVPIDLWMSEGLKRKIESALGLGEAAFLDAHDVDFRYIRGPRYIGPRLRRFADGSEEDLWGVRRKAVRVDTGRGIETYREVVDSPLSRALSVEAIENYGHWPSPDWFDYSEVEAQCKSIRQQERVVVFMGDRLNRIAQLKPAMYLRGIEEIFVDLVVNPDLARAVFAKIRRFCCSYVERVLDAARGQLDILLMGDDFGSQTGPLLSPDTWVAFLGEGFSDYIDIAGSYGVRVMHHTCGGVQPLIPLMLERGLSILQSLQPEASGMDSKQLKADFGDRLAFHGGISIQTNLPFGTPADVRREVRDRVDALAPGGGYILCSAHNIQADTPIENVMALLGAYSEFGNYS